MESRQNEDADRVRRAMWRRPLLEAALVTLLVLGLFYYWFGVADRYAVFLYGHTGVAGARAEPFDDMTSGRYWMSGLVAAGVVMVLNIAAHWLAGRAAVWLNRRFVPAPWWRVWLLSAIPLSVGLPMITMTVNSPTLPPTLAAACLASTLLGLAVAVMPGKWAAERPLDLLWLAADSVGLMPPLLLLHAVEFAGRGSVVSSSTAWLLVMGSLLAGALWMAGISALRLWRRRTAPGAGALLLAGLGLSYLLMPLVHYLLFTPRAYRYISAAENFFASNAAVQALALVVAAILAVGTTDARRWLSKRMIR